MSTFKGYVKEFPSLAIDYFRSRPIHEPAVLAYLLSHTHSDHLQGLDRKGLGGAFIYCSQATKNILLILEERTQRVLHDRGELDRVVPKYKHLAPNAQRNLIRVLPLNVPTRIPLGDRGVCVTLLDANHCPGATMFLIQDDQSAILYTGDMRADSMFLPRFLHHPSILPYTLGLKVLDCLYLDTSARPNGAPYQTQVEGCRLLMKAIARYPATTQFYFSARCTGYELLWLAIARLCNTQIHIDSYHKRLYTSLSDGSYEYGVALAGHVTSVLTADPDISTRFHSCESINPCSARPDECHEIYIKAVNAITSVTHASSGPTGRDEESPQQQQSVGIIQDSGEEALLLDSERYSATSELEHLTHEPLPSVLLVPFARHSSWPELIDFVKALRPREVHSCTNNVGHLFAEYCLPMQISTSKVNSYYALAESGQWHESPRSKRQCLMNDILL